MEETEALFEAQAQQSTLSSQGRLIASGRSGQQKAKPSPTLPFLSPQVTSVLPKAWGLMATNGCVSVKTPREKLFAPGLRQYFQGSHEKQEAQEVAQQELSICGSATRCALGVL